MRKPLFPEKGLPQKETYHIIKKQLELDAQPNFNLAIFATSEMDEYATKIINESWQLIFQMLLNTRILLRLI